jgi:hypothetical protein
LIRVHVNFTAEAVDDDVLIFPAPLDTLRNSALVRAAAEALEERVLPASLVWVGDISQQWSAGAPGATNWDTNTLPASADSLTFPDVSGSRLLDNNSTSNNTYSLAFASGGYTITGNSIRLANAGTDVIQIAGPNLLQTPLQLDACRRRCPGWCT